MRIHCTRNESCTYMWFWPYEPLERDSGMPTTPWELLVYGLFLGLKLGWRYKRESKYSTSEGVRLDRRKPLLLNLERGKKFGTDIFQGEGQFPHDVISWEARNEVTYGQVKELPKYHEDHLVSAYYYFKQHKRSGWLSPRAISLLQTVTWSFFYGNSYTVLSCVCLLPSTGAFLGRTQPNSTLAAIQNTCVEWEKGWFLKLKNLILSSFWICSIHIIFPLFVPISLHCKK